MNSKGFINVVLVILIVVLICVAGYFTIVKKLLSPSGQQIPAPQEVVSSIPQETTPTPKTLLPKKIIRVAVILFGPANTFEKLYTKKQIQEQMFTNPDSVKNFYEEGSFHQWSLAGDVFGEYLVPDSGDGTCQTEQWSDEALTSAKNAGVDLNNYTNFIFVFPTEESGCTVGGWHVFGGNKSWVLNPSTNTFIHELGHAFDLAHANTLECYSKAIDSYSNCQDQEYGDLGDVMGGYSGPVNGGVTEFNGPHKVALGWIPDSNILTISSSGTYTIRPLEKSSQGVQIIKIKKVDTDEYYYLEYRQPIGVFDSKLASNLTRGASIRVWNDYPRTTTKLIDVTPGGCIPSPITGCMTSDFVDASLFDGASFNDSINNITIEQLSHNSDGVTVKITLGSTQ